MIRININIAIVDMIDANHRKVTNNTIIASECIEQKENYTSEFFTNTTRETVNQSRHSSLERMLLDALGVSSFHTYKIRSYLYLRLSVSVPLIFLINELIHYFFTTPTFVTFY